MKHDWSGSYESSDIACTKCGACANWDTLHGQRGFPFVVNPQNHDIVFLSWDCSDETRQRVQLVKAMRFLDGNVDQLSL